MYRLIADTGGAFVQPALYEAFGLTVVEVGKTGIIDSNSNNSTINKNGNNSSNNVKTAL